MPNYPSKSAYLDHEKRYNTKVQNSYSSTQCEKFKCEIVEKETRSYPEHVPRQINSDSEYYSRKIDYIRYSKTGDCNLVDRDRQVNDRSISSADKHFYLKNCHRIHDNTNASKSYNEFVRKDPKFTTL